MKQPDQAPNVEVSATFEEKPADFAWGPRLVEGGTQFRLWAPAEEIVILRLDGQRHRMEKADNGWFEVMIAGRPFGREYVFELSKGLVIADPASRCQAHDVSSPSIIVNPDSYQWTTTGWRGRPWPETIIYELHIGTFTAEGTFQAAIDKLDRLAALGITAIEIMPVAHFPGERGWGYDGVLQYAPHRAYGTPEEFKALIDAAHQRGLMVFLDLVYNHFGPEGNYLGKYAPAFFHEDQHTPWGAAINFSNGAVRRYFLDNVLYWLGEFRLDGLRFDAIDYIEDDSEIHLLQEISETVRAAFPKRHIHLMTENPPNGTDLLAKGLFVADWNDTFHHVTHRIATGETTGHFEEFKRNPWEKLRLVLAEGYLSPGQPTVDKNLPAPASLPLTAFIHFLQNHDQVGNRALGDRLASRIDDRLYRALVCILLLSPQIPLLFMGDDYKEINSFHYFSDYEGELAAIIRANRPQEAENFGGYPAGSSEEDIPDPNALSTFQTSKLRWDHAETTEGVAWSNWIRDMLVVRQTKIVPLLAEAGGYAGTIVPSPAETVFVDWQLGQTTLQLRANLSAVPCSFEPCGDLVFTSGSDPQSLDLGSFEVKVFVLKS